MDDSAPQAETKSPLAGLAGLPLLVAPWVAAAAGAGAAFWFGRRGRKAKGDVAATAAPVIPTPESCARAEPGRGRDAKAPWGIPGPGWIDIVWRAYWAIGRLRLDALAGGVTFYLLLATFPALAAFVSVYGLFLSPGTVAHLVARLQGALPGDAVGLIGGELTHLAAQKHAALGAAFGVSTLISIWSANAGLKSLIDGLNVAYGEVEKRYYVWRTLVTYGATVAALTFMVAVTLLTVGGPSLLRSMGLGAGQAWLAPVRWLTVYLLAAGAFTLLYRHGPSRAPPRWRWVVCGGAGAALAWMVGSILYANYLNDFAHFGATYGSLGAVVGFMLWVWLSATIILAGGALNAEIEHQTALDTTKGPAQPIGKRGAAMSDSLGKAFILRPEERAPEGSGPLRRRLAAFTAFIYRGPA